MASKLQRRLESARPVWGRTASIKSSIAFHWTAMKTGMASPSVFRQRNAPLLDNTQTHAECGRRLAHGTIRVRDHASSYTTLDTDYAVRQIGPQRDGNRPEHHLQTSILLDIAPGCSRCCHNLDKILNNTILFACKMLARAELSNRRCACRNVSYSTSACKEKAGGDHSTVRAAFEQFVSEGSNPVRTRHRNLQVKQGYETILH